MQNKLTSLLLTAGILASVSGLANAAEPATAQMLYKSGTQGQFKGPEKLFTGDVSVEMLFPANDTTAYSGAYVTFQPGARTAWHLHPAGQHMVITSGVALTGTRDGKIITAKAGDSVWCPPNLEHWHGATPDAPMTHLVITNSIDGKNVIWGDKVTDEQYLSKAK
ncbi:cupin domain-containing protein [Shewanella avicenniae]|uniref:Cupin domain-containing protein n=1 Tax=Shewanella avicenniae TaxID=2814294 RepID=A0ABX7QLM6_9GAMM|nr:cupin domain-containing protein [Shewanella avicenniae]QSX32356.1 cupin domain-containing protein [Shewanella avicenniae]